MSDEPIKSLDFMQAPVAQHQLRWPYFLPSHTLLIFNVYIMYMHISFHSFFTTTCRPAPEMAELMGAIASGIGIASFAIQLAESIQKLKALCDDIRDAPESISSSLEQLDMLNLQVQEVASEEQENPQVFASSTSLQQCITLCKQGTAALAEIVNELEKEMTTGKRIWGKLKVVLKKDTLRKLASRLESARGSLMMSYMMYSNALRRLDTHLIVTEVRKVQISTQHISLAASGAGVDSLTSTVSSSVQPQVPRGQDNSAAARTKITLWTFLIHVERLSKRADICSVCLSGSRIGYGR
ncbi:hypothetical protein BDV97DRAFT_60144 [Delphinella strobiligena]|nr:hypothetical protein BDV97DRAFT_60144 [Delphinella strobiligena]